MHFQKETEVSAPEDTECILSLLKLDNYLKHRLPESLAPKLGLDYEFLVTGALREILSA